VKGDYSLFLLTMALILHIETATKVCSVGLSRDGELIELLEESSDKYIHAERLTVLIEQLIIGKNLNFSDLSAVAVTSGPGSYTGLRIGVSTAKGLCYALDIPLIAVNAIDGLIEQAKSTYPESTICGMIDAKRMEVFSKIIDTKGNLIKDLSADELDESSYNDFMPFIACGDGAEKCKTIWGKEKVTFDETIKSSVKGQVNIAFDKFGKNEFEDLAYFEPLYLKDFIATKSKKKYFS
tara:strand:- start:8948 stop:9661 length:714 start_codon:yes stop_codon:yes gene_type:complete